MRYLSIDIDRQVTGFSFWILSDDDCYILFERGDYCLVGPLQSNAFHCNLTERRT